MAGEGGNLKARNLLMGGLLFLFGAALSLNHMNCFKVVGTTNPKKPPKQPDQTVSVNNFICKNLQACSGEISNCDEVILNSRDIASALLFSPLNPTLAAAIENDQAGRVLIDQPSLNRCMLDSSNCESMNTLKVIDEGRVDQSRLSSFLGSISHCRRFLLDHATFSPLTFPLPHDLGAFSNPPVVQAQQERLFFTSLGSEIKIYTSGANIGTQAPITYRETVSPRFASWIVNASETKICYLAGAMAKCLKKNGQTLAEVLSVDLAEASRRQTIKDFQVFSRPGIESFIALTDTHMILIDNSGVLDVKEFPNGAIYPKKIVQTLESVFIFFPDKGLLWATPTLSGGLKKITFGSLREFTGTSDVLVFAKDGTELLITLNPKSGEVASFYFDLATARFQPIDSTRIMGIPEKLVTYSVSAMAQGIIVVSDNGARLTFANINRNSKFTEVYDFSPNLKVFDLRVSDFDGDGHDDLFLDRYETETLMVLKRD